MDSGPVDSVFESDSPIRSDSTKYVKFAPMSNKSISHPIVPVILLVVGAAGTRLIPHPFNFTAIGAMALFSGAVIRDRRLAYLIPFAAMFLSDVVLGLHPTLLPVYLCFAFSVWLGRTMNASGSVGRVVLSSLLGSLSFYLVTNLPVFYPGVYDSSLNGLVQSYTAALPFFRNQLVGDLFYSGALFGSYAVIKHRYQLAGR